MSEHALYRIMQRYGREFTFSDISQMIKAIKKGNCYVLDPTIEDRIIVLLHYNKAPLKLVYSPGVHRKGCIVTALPLDVDEWNKYASQIPEVIVERNNKIDS